MFYRKRRSPRDSTEVQPVGSYFWDGTKICPLSQGMIFDFSGIDLGFRKKKFHGIVPRYSPWNFVWEGLKMSSKIEKKLDDTLLKHSLCHLHKACDVSTLNVVNSTVSLCTKLNASLVDRLHDEVELIINLLTCP